jgi:hypothetical protein
MGIQAGRHVGLSADLTSRRPGNPKSEIRNPVDAFIPAKLNESNQKPAPYADRDTLIRRATYDLTGLPPTPEEIAAFVKDKSSNAFDKLVERLLTSSHYGEKMARHWLDVVRYADTDGYSNMITSGQTRGVVAGRRRREGGPRHRCDG